MQSPHTNLSVMKLYILIQRFLGRKYVHYFVLFFILISIAAIIGSSYEEMAAYRLPLFGVTYVSSFVFLVEYIARILSAPALYPGRKAVKEPLLLRQNSSDTGKSYSASQNQHNQVSADFLRKLPFPDHSLT